MNSGDTPLTLEALHARIEELESHVPEGVLESKTLRFLLLLLGFAFIMIVFSTVMIVLFGVQVPYVSDFFNLIGLNGGVGTTRNVVADHVMPAWSARQNSPPVRLQEAATSLPAFSPPSS